MAAYPLTKPSSLALYGQCYERSGLQADSTAQICTEILYQPLALLDCLHSFCGSCLKEWFAWQASSASTSRRSTHPYTCPSCRESVRGTKADWRLTTLLEGYLKANPERAKSEQEKEELRSQYKPGDNVLAPVQSSRHEDDSADERLLAQATRLSLADLGAEAATRRDGRRRAQDGGSDETRLRYRSNRLATRHAQLTEQRLQQHDTDRPQIEHQPSLRSLLSASDAESQDVQAEILQSIYAEGLLDGIDIDHLTTEQEEELTERIAEAYRRRQRRRDRSRNRQHQGDGEASPRAQQAVPEGSGRNTTSQNRTSPNQRSPRSRPPVTTSYLFEPSQSRAHQRSTSATSRQSNRSATLSDGASPASRSATDLSRQPSSTDGQRGSRTRLSNTGRSVTDPATGGMREEIHRYRAHSRNTDHEAAERRPSSSGSQAVEVSRSAQGQSLYSAVGSAVVPEPEHGIRAVMSTSAFAPETIDGIASAPQAPSIKCNRCERPDIQHALHYNCSWCLGGEYNLCLNCYREGQGCNHWFGFGFRAFERWYRTAPPEGWPIGFDRPHILNARRYEKAANPNDQSSNSSTQRASSLEEGAFCESCLRLANDCYWYCNVCLEGAWGYCNSCVNQGKHCNHPLLAVVHLNHLQQPHYEPSKVSFVGLPHLRQDTYVNQPVVTGCDICQRPIPPDNTRYHCYNCHHGDYDICNECYHGLVAQGKISQTNGPNGWRRCLQGHRMAIIGYQDTFEGGHLRMTVREPVGGWAFKEDEISLNSQPPPRGFPPDGGIGMRCLATFNYFPKDGVSDELSFPKNAEIREVEDKNGDWFWGVYAGAINLFPSNHVRAL